jgi:hypothetical protein
LHRYILKPHPLIKASVNIEHIKKIGAGAKYGFYIYLAIAVMAWWLPYAAIVLSLLIWIYWLYLSVSVKHDNQE